MSLSPAGIISVGIFFVVAYSCYRNGLYSTLVMLFVMAISGTMAMALMIPLAKIPLFATLTWYTPAICFLGTFLLCLVILQTLANFLYPPRLTLPKQVDVVGGAVLGLLNAYFLTGVLMTGLGLFPGTGEAEDKVVFLGADAFFAHSMALISRHTGSVPLNADEFLHNVRKEKYDWQVMKERYDPLRGEWRARDFDDENRECATRIWRIGNALQKFLKASGGKYPETLRDLSDYLEIQGPRTDEAIAESLICPVTHFRYNLFPVRNYKDVEGDANFVLLWDAVGGEAGHLGRQEGHRPALFAANKEGENVRWPTEGELRALLAAQKNAMRKDE